MILSLARPYLIYCLDSWNKAEAFILYYAILIHHRNAACPVQRVKQGISVKGILGSYKETVFYPKGKANEWLLCLLASGRSTASVYLVFKSEEWLPGITCMF